MNRKTIIRCVVALGALGAGATALWLAEDKGELRVTFAGISTNNSYTAWFTVTNSSRRVITYAPYVAEHLAGPRTNYARNYWGNAPTIEPHRATNYQTSSYSTNRWRVEISYQEIRAPSWAFRTRRNLMRRAANQRWLRLARWLQPIDKWEAAFGPEMLGNKPVEVEFK